MLRSPFWKYARRMLRRKWTVTFAIAMAFVSAAGLGVGILGLKPVLERVLGETKAGLRDLANEWNQQLDEAVALTIPQAWIDPLPNTPWAAVFAIVAALALLTFLGAIANFLHAYLAMTVSLRTTADIRREAYHRILFFPLARVTSAGAADLISRVVNDTHILAKGFQTLTSRAIAQLTKGLAALIAAFIFDWRLTLITMTVVPLIFLIIRKIGKRIRRASKGAMRGHAQLLAASTEALQSLRVVKVYAGERQELGRFTKHNNEIVRQQLRARAARAISGPITETITIFALGTLVIIAVKAILDGELLLSEFILTLGALALAGAALKPLAGVVQDINTAEAAAQRIDNILDEPLENQHDRERKQPPLPPHTRSIRFDHVSLTYPNANRPAVDDISLDIHKGSTIAFVGPNGSGKTTLLAMVPRLLEPTMGRVLIDDTDIRTVALRSLRKQIAVVTQEVLLFRGTIADNIAYANRDATQEQIIDAAKTAHAHDFIQRLPDAYDTIIADAGMSLSGGQRQRLSIARAILRDPTILILDEATSMIDPESEQAIAATLNNFANGRTVLVVAHRIATVRAADRVIVLDEGRIVDQGTHDQLLTRSPIYQTLAGTAKNPHQTDTPAHIS